MKRALLLFIFFSSLLTIPARLHVGDPYTWREEARALILYQRLDVPPAAAQSHGEPDQFFVKNVRNDRYFSKYGVMNGLLNTVPLWFEYKIHHSLPEWDSAYRRLYLGLFSVLISVLIAWLLFRIASRYTESPGLAALYTLLCVFATYLHYYLRASNTEATQVLFFCAYFESVLLFRDSGFKKSRYFLLSWVFVLCLALTKISFLLLVPLAILPGLAREDRFRLRAILETLLPCLAIAGIIALVNFHRFGSPFHTGYTWAKDDLSNTLPAWRIIPNLFFNEQWGLLSHFPLLLLVPFGARRFYRERRLDFWFLLLIALAFFFSIGRLPIWKGEWGYGPRYFLFALPVLCLPALPALEWMLSGLRRKSAPALAASVTAMLVFGYSSMLQLQVARLDPFFYYWVRPPVVCDKNEDVKTYFAKTHFGRFNAEFWAHRDSFESLWWLEEVRKNCPREIFVDYRKNLETWIQRTNFYWFSPRD